MAPCKSWQGGHLRRPMQTKGPIGQGGAVHLGRIGKWAKAKVGGGAAHMGLFNPLQRLIAPRRQ